MKEEKPIPLGAQLIAYEIALVSLLQVIARTQPTAAQLVASAMRDTATLVPKKSFPGVCDKIKQYIEVIEAETMPSNESPESGMLYRPRTKSALQ